jgi:hypothetical protein
MERPPPRREVPVEVDAVRVLPRVVDEAVGIEGRDEPEILARVHLAERRDHRQAGAFVAVDTADDQDTWPRTGDVNELDRPVLNGITQHNAYR